MSDIKSSTSLLRCVSFCTAASYDISSLANYFRKRGYSIRLLRDVLHVTNAKRYGDIFFFNHGCFVCWGFKKKFEEKLVEIVKAYSIQAMAYQEADHFSYHYDKETTVRLNEKLNFDIITLGSDDPSIKLAISYGLAQSIKLEAFEEAIQIAIKTNSVLPQEIATLGVISLSRRDIFKRIGEIFLARSSINLNMEYLDAPEFFWLNPIMEPYYIITKKYLDIPSRVMALNHKLDVLQELLDILNSQVQHSHSSFLESIIIVLIVVEIFISLFGLHIM